MIVAVPREAAVKERRVALVPETVSRFTKANVAVSVQRGAGEPASFPDGLYVQAGASLADDTTSLAAAADVFVTVGRPSEEAFAALRPNSIVVGFLNPLEMCASATPCGCKSHRIGDGDDSPHHPRAGHRRALFTKQHSGLQSGAARAEALPKFFPMLTTAAGTIRPAKALILGAGVAGLQAIATARRLGAVVSGYDVRAVIKRSSRMARRDVVDFDLGECAKARGAMRRVDARAARASASLDGRTGRQRDDVVITTARVPGREAPDLITEDAIAAMKPGIVIVDLAAEAGGNYDLTKAGETVLSPGGLA